MKSQKGVALITILVLIVVIFAFAMSISLVIDKNLKFFSHTARKATAHSMATAAMDYMIAKGGAGNITFNPLGENISSTGQIRLDPNEPYYFEIQDINSSAGEYRFIGAVKDAQSGAEITRTVLRVIKPLPQNISDLRKVWIE